MKKPVILSFAAGAACGALGFWLLQPAAQSPPQGTSAGSAASKPAADSKAFTAGKVAKQEKPVPSGGGDKEKEDDVAGKIASVAGGLLNQDKMDEMMRKNAEREVNREVDRLSLRLRLTDAQKESLRKFLTDQKTRERERVARLMKGDSAAVADAGKEPSKEDFLKDLLNDEQDAEYAKARQEERAARAEDYAQRKIRKLDRDLNLTRQQEDALFQSFAQRKLTEPEGESAGGNFLGFSSGDGASGHMSIAIAGDAGGIAEPIEIDMPDLDIPIGSGGEDKDRPLLEPVLTPEQLAVYDQRRKEQAEQMKGAIRIESAVQIPEKP